MSTAYSMLYNITLVIPAPAEVMMGLMNAAFLVCVKKQTEKKLKYQKHTFSSVCIVCLFDWQQLNKC